jgi:hypothetical protein
MTDDSVQPLRTAGVKITGLLRARRGVSVEEFHSRWIEDHVERFSLKFPYLTGLRCNLAIQERTGEQVFDGTQDMWWDSVEAMEEALRSDHRPPASENIRSFAVPFDLVMQEWRLLGDGQPPSEQRPAVTPGIKVVALLEPKPGIASPAAVEKEWIRGHLISKTLKLERLKELRACISNPGEFGRQAFDAVEDLWWNSEEDFRFDVESAAGVGAHLSSAEIMWSTDLIVQEYVFI